MTGLLDIERDKLDLRKAAWAVIAILVAGVLEFIIGADALQIAVATFVVWAAGRAGDLRARLTHMAVITLIGGAFGFAAYLTAETAWQAAIVLAVVTYVTGLGYAFGPAVGRMGYFLLLWTLAVLIGQAHGGDPGTTAIAFLVGGLVAIGVTLVQARLEPLGDTAEDARSSSAPAAQRPALDAVVRSDLGLWSLVRSMLTVVAVVVGYALSGSLAPYWTAIVLLIVLLPDRDDALAKAVQRSLGTVAGVAVTVALLAITSADAILLLVLAIGAFGSVAFYRANYLIYAFFLTVTVLLYYDFVVGQDLEGPARRLVAMLIGIGLALLGSTLVEALRRRRSPPPPRVADA